MFIFGRYVHDLMSYFVCVCDLRPKEGERGERKDPYLFFFPMAIWVWEITE